MAFQQARPYDTGADTLDTMGDIQRLIAGQRQNRLGDLQFQLEQQKAQRANTAYQAQQTLLNQITDPRQRLAALMAPDKFASSVFRDPKDNFAVAGEAGVWDYSSGTPTFIPRPGRGQYRDMNNNPIGGGGPGGAAPGPAQAPGANLANAGNGLDLNGFRTARRRFETGGHPNPNNAANPNSTARGPDQFIESTWERLMLSKGRPFIDMKIGAGADVNDPKVKQAIQDLRNDEEVSGAMAEAYAEENAKELQGAGIPATNRNLTVAHFLGGSGAKRFLSASPNEPAANHADPAQVNANRGIFFDQAGRPRTVSEVLGEVDKRIGEVTGQQATAGAGASGTASGTASGDLEPIYNDKGELDTHFGKDPATGRVKRYPTSASTNVNIGDKTGTQTLVKARAERLGELRNRGLSAAQMRPKLQILRDQLAALKTQGPGSGTVLKAAGIVQTVARAFGMDDATVRAATEQLTGIGANDPETAAKANKIVADLVNNGLRATFSGMGSSSNQEMQAIVSAQANPENPLEANMYLIDNILGPAMDRDIALWNRVRPLQRDPELTGLDDEEWSFTEEWNRQHQPPAAPNTQQASATDTVPNPTVQDAPKPPPSEQEVRAKFPGAIQLQGPDGKPFWAAPDPTSKTGYRRVVVQ